MKRIISNVMLVAAAATAFFSCQKQEVIAPETEQEVMLTFASEKPAFDDETKTEWTGETIQWSAGDKISIAYTVDGDWMGFEKTEEDQTVVRSNPKLYKSDPLTEATEVAKFNVSSSFNIADEGAHVFYGVYPAPSSTSFDDAPVASLSVPPIQTPNASSFDGAADLMTGVSVDAFNSIAEAKAENISMKWTRLVAHANITLKALKDVTAGETISSIKLTAQEGANLVGSQKVNLLTNEVECNNNESNVIDLMGGNLSVSDEGNIEFWACFLPTTLTSLKVEVETNKASYTREITGIEKTFKQNARNTLSIKMNEATRVAKEEESWVLVRPADGLTEGTYALVASTSTKTGVLVSTNGSGSAPAFNTGITIEDNVLKGVTESMQFDIAGTAENYEIYVAGGTSQWLYCTNANNGVRVGTNTNKTWTISAHNKNINAFTFKHNATNRYLGVYNNQDWRCYDALTKLDDVTGNTGAIYLYKKTSGPVAPDTTPAIVVSGEPSKNVEFGGGEVTFKYELKNLDGEELTWEVSDEEMISSVSAEDGVLTVTVAENDGEARTATITLSCGDADDVVLILNQAEYVDASVIEEITVADFLSKSVDANVWYQLTGTIKEIKNTTYGNFYLEDETGYVYVYGLTKTQVSSNDKSFESIGLREGDTVTLIGTRAQYASASVADQKEQVGGPAYYVSHVAAPYVELTMESASVDAETTSYTVDIKSNSNWTASASTDVTLDKTSGNGDASIKMTFTENTTSDAVTHTLTVAVEGSTKTFTLTQKGVVSGGDNEPVVVFAESFSKSTGTMGWSDNAGNGTFATDNTGWTVDSAYGAGGSAKFGTSKKLGKATTPALNITGNATLKFKAGAWTGDQTNLKLSMSGGTLSVTSVTMKNATWTEYEVTITNATSGAKVTFEGQQASKARFFLDDIEIIQN